MLTTKRLLLRRQREQDARSIADLLNNWNVSRWLPRMPYPYDLDEARRWIALATRNWENGRDHQFVVTRSDGGELIGHCGLTPDRRRGADFGYWYGEPYWGNGYAKEAGRAVVDYGFATLGLARVWAYVHPDNHRSLGVLLASGLRQVDIRPVTYPALGKTVDCPYLVLERPPDERPMSPVAGR